MRRSATVIGVAVGAVLATALSVGLASAAVVVAPTSGSPAPSARAAATIPAGMLSLYGQAATVCPGLPWTVLAAIGTVESGNGTSDLPGVHAGANAAGAEGPMQFEPATFARYDLPVPPGGAAPPSPYDPVDAVYAAARDLCANGAAGSADLAGAVFAYNHDARYVAEVLGLARAYGTPPPAGPVGAAALAWALAQVGTPYVWGGERPGVGFDCSGLVQAAYQAAGVRLPRVAQAQYDVTPKVPPGTALSAGDLVFFGAGPMDVTHVGIYAGDRGGRPFMVDAPHRGAVVRVEAFPAAVGDRWGGDRYLGATRPAG